ncbi:MULTISPECIES: DUF2806 domain-containing protein [unclassified Brevundimonas]
MSDDHLSNEVSISAELTERGVKAGAKSRTLAAVDRLLGGVVDLANVPIERIAQKGRAKTDTQVAAIKALGEKQLEAIHSDPDFAARAMQQHLKVIGTRQENKTEAVRAALEDLRETPPTEEQNNSGGEQLDDAFLNRWERYAEDATSDQLREKWGRILAGEIRAPGTFSSKVMRIVDELEPNTALLFERFCAARVGMTVLGCLAPAADYVDLKRLVAAGLMVDPGEGGQIRRSSDVTDGSGHKMNLFSFGGKAVAFDDDQQIEKRNIYGSKALNEPLTLAEGKPAIPVYLLTDVGHAISSIIGHDEISVVENYLIKLSEDRPDLRFREFSLNAVGSFSLVKLWGPPKVEDAAAGEQGPAGGES